MLPIYYDCDLKQGRHSVASGNYKKTQFLILYFFNVILKKVLVTA